MLLGLLGRKTLWYKNRFLGVLKKVTVGGHVGSPEGSRCDTVWFHMW